MAQRSVICEESSPDRVTQPEDQRLFKDKQFKRLVDIAWKAASFVCLAHQPEYGETRLRHECFVGGYRGSGRDEPCR